MFSSYLSWLYWDPKNDIFTVPLLNRPIAWYGVLFVSGFILGYFIVIHLLKEQFKISKDLAAFLTDRLCWFVVAGTIIGARLGHVFLYEWPHYSTHPLNIFKTWEGGLASHGAVLGILLSLYLYQRIIASKQCPELSFLRLSDLLSIPGAIGAAFIRLGNFVNQEIVGTKTNVPWAVIFGHPFESHEIVPRHPVQLYEASAYLLTAGILYSIWRKKKEKMSPGQLSGLLFMIVFTARFFLEFFKEHQYSYMESSSWSMQMGQLLSLPYILLGILLFFWQKILVPNHKKF